MSNRLWRRWKGFAHRAAEFQSIVILTGLYWVVVVPIGLIQRLTSRPVSAPHWKRREQTQIVSVADARRQF